MAAKISTIMFVANLSADFNDEIRDLEDLINACDAGEDKADDLKKQYRHLSSFLSGVDYMIEYITDDEAKEELRETSEKIWHGSLQSYWGKVMEIVWSKELGAKVYINTIHDADGRINYTLIIDSETINGIRSKERLVEILRARKGA